MKILSAEEIRLWDQYTIAHEPISSIDLMERAANACVEWIGEQGLTHRPFIIFCGKGNNGGDGLAIARLLLERMYRVTTYILEFGHMGTPDFQANLARLHNVTGADIRFIQNGDQLHPIPGDAVLVDALFGSGLNRRLEGITADLVSHINASGCLVISIDIPSGMFVDRSSRGNAIVRADHTLTFQCYKPAFLFPENDAYIGEVHTLDIGLHKDFYHTVSGRFELINENIIQSIHRPRKRFSHKGDFGHTLLVAGSYGKIGAAVLAAKACLRSGTGLLTCHIPQCGYAVLQVAVPEAMVMTDFNSSFNTRIEDDITKYDAIGIGRGLGTASETKMLLREIFDAYRSPVVLDADALNLLASQKDMLRLIPGGSILTPHPKEFERLFGETGNDFDRVQLALDKANELNVVIVLKGHHTFIATPGGRSLPGTWAGEGFFNSSGNPGMATAGSGDVLTGILTGLLGQGYSSTETAILGVYLHGLAGDIAAAAMSMESMIAGDITAHLGQAFLRLGNREPS